MSIKFYLLRKMFKKKKHFDISDSDTDLAESYSSIKDGLDVINKLISEDFFS